jgi:hypothetical protein
MFCQSVRELTLGPRRNLGRLHNSSCARAPESEDAETASVREKRSLSLAGDSRREELFGCQGGRVPSLAHERPTASTVAVGHGAQTRPGGRTALAPAATPYKHEPPGQGQPRIRVLLAIGQRGLDRDHGYKNSEKIYLQPEASAVGHRKTIHRSAHSGRTNPCADSQEIAASHRSGGFAPNQRALAGQRSGASSAGRRAA